MEKRNLDGIYFRIQRDDKWDNVCFSDLTKDERNEVIENRSEQWLKEMCQILADVIVKKNLTLGLIGENMSLNGFSSKFKEMNLI